jgi:hypothetical protein
MNDKKQKNRITVWFLFDPSDTIPFREGKSPLLNVYKTEKPSDYSHQFQDTLFDIVTDITKGTEWGIAFRQTDEATPSFEAKIYLDDAQYLDNVIDAVKNNNKDIVFECWADGDFSDYINRKFNKDYPADGVML